MYVTIRAFGHAADSTQCIQELRSKAKYFEKSGIVPTLDATATVAKSDKLVSDDLHKALLKAFQILKTDQADSPDWHPNSNDRVQDLVHPSMYPLVYQETPIRTWNLPSYLVGHLVVVIHRE